MKTDRASVAKHYSRLARVYDNRWPFYIEATTRETLARAKLAPRDRVLDVGCGTGALLHRLSERRGDVELYGVDAVPAMLEIARRRLPSAVLLCAGWGERLPFAAEQFDVVVSCNMFHYIREPVLALQEMRRVMRPGGRLLITDWCDDFVTCRICDVFLRLFSSAHFKTYRSRECVRLLEDAGQSGVNVDLYKINWLWGLMTVRSTKAPLMTAAPA